MSVLQSSTTNSTCNIFYVANVLMLIHSHVFFQPYLLFSASSRTPTIVGRGEPQARADVEPMPTLGPGPQNAQAHIGPSPTKNRVNLVWFGPHRALTLNPYPLNSGCLDLHFGCLFCHWLSVLSSGVCIVIGCFENTSFFAWERVPPPSRNQLPHLSTVLLSRSGSRWVF